MASFVVFLQFLSSCFQYGGHVGVCLVCSKVSVAGICKSNIQINARIQDLCLLVGNAKDVPMRCCSSVGPLQQHAVLWFYL